MVEASEVEAAVEEEESPERKAHIAWIKRLKCKAALWDELRELAIKRGLVTDGEPHRKVRARLVAALGEFEQSDRDTPESA